MQRSSIIATVIAAGGILVAGSVASVAVINAASSSQPESQTLALVSTDGQSTEPSTATPSTSTPDAPSAPTPSALPTLEAAALPVLPEVTEQPAVQQQTASNPKAAAGSGKAAPSKSQPTAKPASNDSAQPENTVSADQARSTVLKQGDGVTVVATSKDSHKGYDTWAVRITRANGEVLTGYVDRVSGVVIDWDVNQQAPAASTPSASASDDSDDDSGSDHSGSDDKEHESGDDD